MAKSKKSGKKTKTTQPAKEEKLLKNETKKVEKKTNTKKATKAAKAKAPTVEVKAEKKAVEEKVEIKSKETGFFKRIFSKKYEGSENILTIFKNKKVYGALLGEFFGTMFIAMLILTIGAYNFIYLFLLFIAIFVAVHKLSGANLNPISTVGMMVTRRISPVRGVLYLLSQVLGAWVGLLIISAFLNAGGSGVELPSMTAIPEGKFWAVTLIEFFGATMVGFFFARAQQFKHSSLTFAVIATGGTIISLLLVYVVSANFFSLDGTSMLNPAVALMYKILPQSADNVGELLGGVGLALVTYVIFPMIGGALGSILSDASQTLSED